MAPNKKDLKEAEELNALSATSVTNPSESKGLFTVAGLFTSVLPAYLFASVLHLDVVSNVIVYAVFTILASQLLSYSYGLFADKQVHSILAKRSEAVRIEAAKKGSTLNNTEVQRKANAVANHEASFLAIYYNNALFVFLSLFFGFFLFGNFSPAVNYAVSSLFAAGITVLAQA